MSRKTMGMGPFASARLPGGFALAASLVLAAAFLLAPGQARAADECGALNSGNSFTETCADQAYASGITYSVAGSATLTVGGGTATTITSATTGASWNNGITINIANAATRRDASLTVGSDGAVAILQGSSPQANAWYRNNGIQVFLRAGGGSTTTVDVRSGVTIGTSTTRMANSGISLGLDNAAVTGAGDMSLTSGATIYAAAHGINVGNPGPGASTVTNTGAIDASNQGIRVDDSGSAGAVTITNSGAITSGWQGIYAHARGTGKDAAGTNAGVSVTHSAGAITSSGNRGIHALVGTSRQESNTGHASYVPPMNVGTAKVAVTGGSISASNAAIEAINYEAGGIDIDVSSGVTLTSSAGSGIYAGVHDVGNTSGGIDVDNAGEITAARTGIWVRQNSAANTVSVSVDNDGALKKTGAGEGYGIRVEQSGSGDVTIVNSGDIGEATARHRHGIWLANSGSGASTATNNGGFIRASQRGIYVDDTGSAGAVTITNSGTITATWTGILAETTGKDAMGDNHGVSVTHSGGAIASANDQGIQALVGVGRSEGDTGGAGYVAPRNTGTAKVEVTGGSISARLTAIEAINLEAGGVDVDVSSGVTLTSSTASGIFAGLVDVGNTAGAIDVDNAGDVTAAVTGIWVRQNGAMNTGAISVTNEGAIEKTGTAEGYGIRVDQSGNGDVTISNSGAIGDATTQHVHGIWLPNPGSGDSTVTNSGAIRASQRGIYVDDTGSAGAVTVANSGAVTAPGIGIRATTTGKDAEGANAGVSVTHSGGAIASDDDIGILALVGASRAETNTAHADYVAPVNTGPVKVSVTGGSIRSKWRTIGAINFEAGSVEVSVSEGVTLTTTDRDHAIFALAADVGNTDGTVTVTNGGTIDVDAVDRHGIFAKREAGSGAVMVTNSGAINSAGGMGIYADVGAVTVANSADITSELSGIFARTASNDAADANVGVSVTHSGGAIEANGRGIRARVGAERQEIDASHADYVAPMNTGLVKVAVTGGSIRARWPAIEALNYEAGGIDIDVAEGATLTSTANSAINAQLTDVGNAEGTIDIDNAGTLDAAVSGVFARIVAGSGDMTVTNSGAIAADANAIFALGARNYAGDMTVANSGALGAANERERVSRGIFAAHEGPSGAVTVANSGAIAATDYGILASKANGRGGGTTVTHSGGAIDVDSATDAPVLDSQKHGIVARVGGWNRETEPDHPDYVAPRGAGLVKVSVTGGSIASRGTAVEGANYEGGGVEIAIASGATLSSAREHGIEADLRDVGNTDGTIKITQGGAIRAGGDGISAVVTRSTPATLDRPVIDVAWTGTYAAPEQPAPDESIVFVAQAPEVVQAAQAVESVETLRGGSAGIDAKVMEWQAFMGVVAAADDPGAFADAAAQTALFDDAADAATQARAAAIVAQFRSTLTAGTAGSIRDAGDVDGDGDDEYSDAEIVAYLSADSDARRTLLRNVLAKTLTEQEMAVFQAVIEGGDVNAALDAVTGGADAWKTRVRALSESRNDGDIRIAMNGGSIDSPGDGIRAAYAAHRDGNGRIEVTVAEGASVTGAMAGIYIGHGGLGLSIEKRYASEGVRDANENLGEDATVTDEGRHNHVVRVHGTVTGGTDAAVHMDGGGALIVGPTGRLIAGSSGRAVRVNHPHPANVFIDGEVKGGAGAQAAVDMTGGRVTVSRNGRVEANGAASAIRGGGEQATRVEIDGTVQGAEGGGAAVHLTSGGRVTIGLNGRVEANGAQLAIRGDGEPVRVLLHAPGQRLTQENANEALARVSGGIGGNSIVGARGGGENQATLVLVETDDGRTTGHYTDLPIGADGNVATDELPVLEFDCAMAEDGRCRLYEALPSALLAMNGLPTYAERTSSARDARGGWARVEGASGAWKAETSTQPDVAYDYSRYGARAGVDFLADETGRLGLSVHNAQGTAEMESVGEAEMTGSGVGVHATTFAGGFHVDIQTAMTWYDVDLKSALHGRLKDGVSGRGYAVGVEAGRRMSADAGGVSVTPRAGLSWSKVALDAFTDEVGVGARVSVDDAESLKGRAGVAVEAGDAGGRLFGSVDVEHEFSAETEAKASRTGLRASAEKTGVRVGMGGSFALGRNASLRGSASYAMGGGGNHDFGAGVNLAVRF